MLCMQKLAVCPTDNFHSHALEPGIDSESLSVKSVSTETRLPMQWRLYNQQTEQLEIALFQYNISSFHIKSTISTKTQSITLRFNSPLLTGYMRARKYPRQSLVEENGDASWTRNIPEWILAREKRGNQYSTKVTINVVAVNQHTSRGTEVSHNPSRKPKVENAIDTNHQST